MKTSKVLVLDDEPSNVEALLEYFASSGIEYDFEDSLENGANLIANAQKDGNPYDAVICDNHFSGSELSEYGDVFDGLDLLNTLIGNEQNMTENHKKFAEDYFGSEYDAITSHYKGKVILFSGSAYGDSLHTPELFSGIYVVQKQPDEEGQYCEADVIGTMRTMGFDFEKDVSAIKDYKANRSLEDGIPSDADHNITVEEFFRKAGLPAEEIDQYCDSEML
ncbi:hypothetical protein ACFL0W_04365 [Nanoarchaeota archaeon]